MGKSSRKTSQHKNRKKKRKPITLENVLSSFSSVLKLLDIIIHIIEMISK